MSNRSPSFGRPVIARVALYGTLLAVVVFAVAVWERPQSPGFDTDSYDADYAANPDVRRLQDLVRIDTTSDAGREIDAARFLGAALEAAGIPVEIEPLVDAKANLWAVIDGESSEALVLHNHLDTDPIRRPDDWATPPFEGRIEPPWIIGRGVFDMKSITVAQLGAMLAVKERMDEGAWRPRRSLVFLATSSEETGSDLGTRRVLATRPDLVERFWAVFTEGGVLEATSTGEVKYWGTSFAQKQFVEVTATSASAERLETLRRDLLLRLESAPPTAVVPEVEIFAAAYGASRQHPDLRAVLADPALVLRDDELFDRLPDLYRSLFRNEAHPFAVREDPAGGYRLRIVLHALPGEDADRVAAELLPVTLIEGVGIDVEEPRGAAHGSPLDHPAYLGLSDSLQRHTGTAAERIGPYLLTRYANDARFFRRHRIAAYGFTPFRFLAVDTMTVSGPNEKIALPAFIDGVELYRQVVFDLLDLSPGSPVTGTSAAGASEPTG